MTSMEEPKFVAFHNVDPVYEWLDDGANYLLRLELPGFRKEDFRVYVNTDGQLTVIAQRIPAPGTGDEGKGLHLRKVFQLPDTANLDTITGRFDGALAVLMLTVPKLQQLPVDGPGAAAAAPPPPAQPQAKEDDRVAGDKPADQEDKAAKVGREAETERRTDAERMTALTARSREEDEKAKTVAPLPPQQQKSERASGEQREEAEDEKARADHKEEVSREASRRIEAAWARVAEAKAKAERERKCEQWKERAMEEGLKFADVLNKNKEAIATAVAAFTIGLFVSSRLFSRN